MSTNVKCYYKKTIEWKKKNGKTKNKRKKIKYEPVLPWVRRVRHVNPASVAR